MTKKILIHFLLLFVGVLVGSSIGGFGFYWYANHKRTVAYSRLTYSQAGHLIAVRESLFRVFFVYSAPTVYWSPLKDELPQKLEKQVYNLEELKRATNLQEMQPIASVYLAYAYVRLGRLEEARGDKSRAYEYMAKAKSECAAVGWTDCSDSALKSATEGWVRNSAGSKVAGDYQ
jgi:hypothetical protein